MYAHFSFPSFLNNFKTKTYVFIFLSKFYHFFFFLARNIFFTFLFKRTLFHSMFNTLYYFPFSLCTIKLTKTSFFHKSVCQKQKVFLVKYTFWLYNGHILFENVFCLRLKVTTTKRKELLKTHFTFKQIRQHVHILKHQQGEKS